MEEAGKEDEKALPDQSTQTGEAGEGLKEEKEDETKPGFDVRYVRVFIIILTILHKCCEL